MRLFASPGVGRWKEQGELYVHVLEHIRSYAVVLAPQDEITADTEHDLKDAVRRQLNAGRVHIVLDLQHVPYIDSCGLGRVVQAYVSAQRVGGGLKLMNVNERILHLLTTTRLTSVIEIVEPEREPTRNRTPEPEPATGTAI